jgi:hypothetical protein
MNSHTIKDRKLVAKTSVRNGHRSKRPLISQICCCAPLYDSSEILRDNNQTGSAANAASLHDQTRCASLR